MTALFSKAFSLKKLAWAYSAKPTKELEIIVLSEYQ